MGMNILVSRGGAFLGATGAKPHFIFGDKKKRKVDFRKAVRTFHL
jgi:hypothetical protein